MLFLVSVRPLRHHGSRLDCLGPAHDGYLVVRGRGSAGGLVLVSNSGGVDLLGPLYEARVLNASADGLLLLGYEKQGNAAFVQEWLIGKFGDRQPNAQISEMVPA